MLPNPPITREQFMQFFRNDDQLNTLSPADRIEIFSTIMLGSSDFTKELLDEIIFLFECFFNNFVLLLLKFIKYGIS
jgi:hypothetical protein